MRTGPLREHTPTRCSEGSGRRCYTSPPEQALSGTSASAPAFAAIIGLVAAKTRTRLGLPNYILYRLAAAENLAKCNASANTLPASTCVFNDVTGGNNAVPGETGYGTASPSYKSGTGYDLATGLGSINIANLMSQWSTHFQSDYNDLLTQFNHSGSLALA